jgi:AcrR family transcriptional regulator
MTARAAAAQATNARILDATDALFWTGPLERVTLDAVAARAEVTVPTVIRHFGSKDALVAAAAERAAERVGRQRDQAPIGDVPGAVANLLDHYEEMGERALRLLAEEASSEAMGAITERGRVMHRTWVERTFAPQLARCRAEDRDRRRAQLIAVTDVYVWKLLRRDAGLSRPQVERAIAELIDGLEEER